MKIFSSVLGIALLCISPLTLANNTYQSKQVNLYNNTMCHVVGNVNNTKLVKGNPVILMSYQPDKKTLANPPIEPGASGNVTAYYNVFGFNTWTLFLGSPSDGIPVGSTLLTPRHYVYFIDLGLGKPFFSFSRNPCPY